MKPLINYFSHTLVGFFFFRQKSNISDTEIKKKHLKIKTSKMFLKAWLIKHRNYKLLISITHSGAFTFFIEI